ncbi:MAG: thioredoxin family protein [Desulfococcaceae bacterium]
MKSIVLHTLLPLFLTVSIFGMAAAESTPAPGETVPAVAPSEKAAETEPSPSRAEEKKSPIEWIVYEEGVARGKEDEKKIFLNFYADWCQHCKVMDQKTFKDASVVAYLNEHFIPVRVDSDKREKLAREFNVQALPVSWFIAEDGENIGSQPGYVPPDMMLPLLKYIHTDSYKEMDFQKFMEGLQEEE